MAKEKTIEKKMRLLVEELGGFMLKQNAALFTGIPDRMAVFPCDDGCGPRFIFVEVKQPGEEPTEIQLEVHNDLREIGCEVYVLEDVEQLRVIVKSPRPTKQNTH